jgi:hypothetical protein
MIYNSPMNTDGCDVTGVLLKAGVGEFVVICQAVISRYLFMRSLPSRKRKAYVETKPPSVRDLVSVTGVKFCIGVLLKVVEQA